LASGYRVEAVHLAKNERQEIPPHANLAAAAEKVEAAIEQVRAGTFPPEVDTYNCTHCPHFFICGALPRGKVKLD
jgi:CRISPR/Cas system-associated exonuclease Cas4 (RecB family)